MQLSLAPHARPSYFQPWQPGWGDGPSPAQTATGAAYDELVRLDAKLRFEHPRNYFVSGEWPTDLAAVAGRLRGASKAAMYSLDTASKAAAELLGQASVEVGAFGEDLQVAREQHVPFSPSNSDWLTRLSGPLDAVRTAYMVLSAPRDY